ncbi:MAG: phenylalanine--tRNA ligase subunit beta [Candidatus Krumholzibacteriota bacterium]|nr:phenylalanine--tRNA ligase subunit beta [Candidatus Krumholzibacteriota bacterium]
MKVSLNWLKRYVDIVEDPKTLADDLTMFGLNVEGIEDRRPDFSGVIFGIVTECGKHPDADKLSVCKVDTGQEEHLNIVCGAPNVRAGLNVAVAVNGAVLPGNFKIKKTRIRGQVSEGMICSEIELGIGSDKSGIIELGFELAPGTDLGGHLGSDDVILDIEVTPNRPDQLSHLGIAREIAALYKRDLKEPEYLPLETDDRFKVKIEDTNDCWRYSAACVSDVKIEKSPQWIQKLLVSAGVKPLNNIVDITNFVLMEIGQPLHAFDRDRLIGDTITVRRANDRETLETLDGVKRKLGSSVLVIADSEIPVGIAGVMGGADSEIKDKTKRIVLESAVFDPAAVRKSSHYLKLDTEASYRFEREGDVGITVKALERACYLIKEIGAGEPELKITDNVADRVVLEEKKISIRVSQANRLMGTHLGPTDLKDLLLRLDLESEIKGNEIVVAIPSFRRDIKAEVDLIEEVARVYGYENIGREEEYSSRIFSRVSSLDMLREDLSFFLVSRGYAEVINSSFMDPEDTRVFEWHSSDPRCNPVKLLNPLSLGQSVLRTSLLPGILRTIARNAPVEQEGIKVFEMGRIFLPVGPGDGLPEEKLHLTACFTRKNIPVQWNEKQREFDFLDMKGEIETVFEWIGIESEVNIEREKREEPDFVFNCYYKNELAGYCGMIPGRISKRYEIPSPVFYFSILPEVIHSLGVNELTYSELIPYPAVKRDLCVVASERVKFSDIMKVVKKRAKYLEYIRLFDYYRGGNLGEGQRSYAFRLSFRSPEGTLDDKVVDKVIGKVLDGLRTELQVSLRME